MDVISGIDAALAAHGLAIRGLLNFAPDETPPAGRSGTPAKSVLLIGHAGANYWTHFSHWRATQPDDLPNPLDTWARTLLEAIAPEVGARVLMPNDRPFAPFQQWAMRAEGLRPSPLGLLIHPVYGLWHAFRGALLLDVEVSSQHAGKLSHACDACVGKPCLNACPVDAFSAAEFAYERCLAHVRGPNGSPCRSSGCLARNACPVGVAYRYPASVQAFHQKAFASL